MRHDSGSEAPTLDASACVLGLGLRELEPTHERDETRPTGIYPL
ncbi:hypothetical protein [Streptomyces antimycoticus]